MVASPTYGGISNNLGALGHLSTQQKSENGTGTDSGMIVQKEAMLR